MIKSGCTKCCWCGYKYPTDHAGRIIYLDKKGRPLHMCTGEEKGAVPCEYRNECFKLVEEWLKG